ncbi:MAG TPA: D-alanine--D-alanine ligase [Leucothrix mucor]|uniref:D-alanine--D-alanine ligase n=1 Tax=Leucothrix mucor TaxID=45248 RepID=A0A7V2WV15_LEUMU|nr:D-alanine--D-alanine ligase [Leucothrix mucor]
MTDQGFGKVAVLMGGWAAEREVSLNSGAAVLKALLAKGIDAHKVDADRDVLTTLKEGNFDRVFNIMHGRGGEDGGIQGALDILQIPYTGCAVMASAISMNKLMTKRIWVGAELPTPAYKVLTAETDFTAVVAQLGLPMMVKPANEGSSIGMAKVEQASELQAAYEHAAEYDHLVLAEQWVNGEEYTISLLAEDVLPVIRLEAQSGFYDYEAKYKSDETKYYCPCGLQQSEEKELQALAQKAFKAVAAKGWGRVDVMRDSDGKFWLIEVNTVPGMTDHSLVPMAAKAAEIDFNDLVMRILATSV